MALQLSYNFTDHTGVVRSGGGWCEGPGRGHVTVVVAQQYLTIRRTTAKDRVKRKVKTPWVQV